MTFERVQTLTDPDKILIITNKLQKKEIEKQLPEIPNHNIILEPQGRNTAPCIGLASIIIRSRAKKNEMMVVLPSDHLISRKREFCDTIRKATLFAQENEYLLTIGIQPTFPETGFGYIQAGKKLHDKKVKDVLSAAEIFSGTAECLYGRLILFLMKSKNISPNCQSSYAGWNSI